MGSGEPLDRVQVRKQLDKETAAAVIACMEAGYRVRRLGHGVKLFCPCMGPHTFSVSGSPGKDAREAKRVRREARKCPGVTTIE